MSVSTGKGDKGRTSLYFGNRVSKDHIRVEVFGSLDELCSNLGMAKSHLKDRKLKDEIEIVQRDLFVIGAEIATVDRHKRKLKYRLDKTYVDRLDEMIYQQESKQTFTECCFYLPGQNQTSAAFDIARTVARRTERRLVTCKTRKIFTNIYILKYMNRLSDWLYLLARAGRQK